MGSRSPGPLRTTLAIRLSLAGTTLVDQVIELPIPHLELRVEHPAGPAGGWNLTFGAKLYSLDLPSP